MRTTRRCAKPSRATGVGCSSTPATGCAPYSRRHVPQCTPQWQRNAHWNGLLGGALIVAGQPESWAELCRRSISRRAAKPPFLWAALVLALTLTDGIEAMSAAEGLLAVAGVTDNPHSAAMALFAHGFSRRNADPVVAYENLRRSLATAQRSGNHWIESHVAGNLATLAVTHGDSSEAPNSSPSGSETSTTRATLR
jgi:hypothetical protein